MSKTNLIVIPEEQYEELLAGLRELKDLVLGKAKEEVEKQWLESEEARELLGVSPKTWQNWRDGRMLPFVQFGRKIWVKRADVDAFLESNYVRGRS